MGRATKRKTRETRDRLLDTAEDVFNEKGVSGTTLNDIAEAAGVTRGAIYWHFRNKQDMFDAMFERVRGPIHTMIEEIADEKTADPLGRLGEKSVYLMEQIVENPRYRKVMSILFHKCEYTDTIREIQLRQQEWRARGIETVTRVLRNAIQKGQLPDNLDIRLASLMLHIAWDGLLNSWLLMPDSFDLVKDSQRLHEGILSMLKNSPYLRVKA
jgi:TetR/AcrR family acrAB operon transcriptional repressor